MRSFARMRSNDGFPNSINILSSKSCEKKIETRVTRDSEQRKEIKYQLTYVETLSHYLQFIIANGVPGVGEAIEKLGLILGCFLIACISILYGHCQHKLIKYSEKYRSETDDNSLPDYARTVEISFQKGPKCLKPLAAVARRVVNFFILFLECGCSTVYFAFVAKKLQKMFDEFGYETNIHIFLVAILLPVMLQCLVRTLKSMAFISIVANFFTIFSFAISFYHMSRQLFPFTARIVLGDVTKLPYAIGNTVYVMHSITLVIPLKNELKNDEHLESKMGVTKVGNYIATMLMIYGTIFNYMKLEIGPKGSQSFHLPSEKIIDSAFDGASAMSILFTLPIQMYVPMSIIRTIVKDMDSGPWYTSERFLRLGLVLIVFTTAELIPEIGAYMYPIGSTCSVILVFVFPAILDLVDNLGHSGKRYWIIIVKNSFIILVLGICPCVFEIYRFICMQIM